jgi:hypothetical protein
LGDDVRSRRPRKTGCELQGPIQAARKTAPGPSVGMPGPWQARVGDCLAQGLLLYLCLVDSLSESHTRGHARALVDTHRCTVLHLIWLDSETLSGDSMGCVNILYMLAFAVAQCRLALTARNLRGWTRTRHVPHTTALQLS